MDIIINPEQIAECIQLLSSISSGVWTAVVLLAMILVFK